MLRNTLNTFITATLIMLLGVSSSAQAIVPMGDLMGSTSVTFTGQDKETTYSSPLTIALDPAKPTIREHGGLGNREVEGNKVTVTYTITSRANGPDKYTLAAPYDSGAAGNENAGDLTTEILGADGGAFTNPMSLGATAAIDSAAIDSTDSTTITVICDAASSTASNCNGIEAGDTVIIGDGDTEYTVAEVRGQHHREGPSTIRLDDVPVGILLGTRIAEQKTFKVVVSGVALLDPAEQVTFALDVTGTSTDGNQIGTASLAHTIEGIPINPSVDRYARNLTDLTGNPEAANVESTLFDSGGGLGPVNYYKTGVSAKDTHEVEILIVLKAGNQGPQTDIVLNETLSPFVEYVSGSYRFNAMDFFASFPVFEESALIIDSNHLTIPGENIPPLNIAKNTSVHITYKVKVIGGDEAVLGGDGTTGGGGNNAESTVGARMLAGKCEQWDVRNCGTPWREVVEAGVEENPGLHACWCEVGVRYYDGINGYTCEEEGWVVAFKDNGLDADLATLSRQVATDGANDAMSERWSKYNDFEGAYSDLLCR